MITTIRNDKGPLTKSFSLDDNGELHKENAPTLYQGSFEVLPQPSLKELKDIILNLKSNEALCYSRPVEKSGKITTKSNEDLHNGLISRSKEHFQYYEEEGILCVDIDDPDENEYSVMVKLADCYEPFRDASYLYSSSASHGLGGSGFHLYFRVDDSSSIPQAMSNLFNIASNKGYGVHKISKSGSILKRTFFDKAIYDNARLDFAASPVCINFSAPEREVKVVTKGEDKLDLSGLLETVKLEKREPEQSIKWEQEDIIEKVAKERGVTTQEYKQALETQVLPRNFIFPDGRTLADYPVGVDTEIQNPLEVGLKDKTMLYWNGNSPVIHTFAHGGATYRFDMSTEVTLPKEHKNTEDVLELMRDTYKQRSLTLPEDTLRPFISLMLHQTLEDYQGCYSIQLSPSMGKTQSILHTAIFIGKNSDKGISIAFHKKEDIDQAYDFLKPHVDVVAVHSDSNYDIRTLPDHQILLHTHFRVRDNEYTEKYYTYKDDLRALFIFDEAYFGTLYKSLKLRDAIQLLEGAIVEEEGKNLGLPLSFLKELKKRLKRGNRYLGKPHISSVNIDFPYLSSRFVNSAWRLKENGEFIHSIFLIATSQYRTMVATKEKGMGTGLLAFKVNQSSSFKKMITTDATRDVRTIHELAPQEVLNVSLPEPKQPKNHWVIMPLMADSKSAILMEHNEEEEKKRQELHLHHMKFQIIEFIKQYNIQRLGIILSKGIEFKESDWPRGTVPIYYGQHKQTDKFSECDGLAFLHLHRIPHATLKHMCLAESQSLNLPEYMRGYEVGQIADDIIQGAMRGSRRKREPCPVFIPIKGEGNTVGYSLLDELQDYFQEDTFHILGTGITQADIVARSAISAYRKERKVRKDRKYRNDKEKGLAKNLRRAAREIKLEIDERMEDQYLRDRRTGVMLGPKKWLKENIKTDEIRNKPTSF